VVTFVYRNYPRDKPRRETRILEIGCGAGNNLWFAAREGFQGAGTDGNPTAIEYARRHFGEERLEGDFETGDFTSLPFGGETVDLAVDRASIACCPRAARVRPSARCDACSVKVGVSSSTLLLIGDAILALPTQLSNMGIRVAHPRRAIKARTTRTLEH